MFFKEGSSFPPAEWEYIQCKYNEFQAWYSGDTEQLLSYYANKVINPYSERALFWARLEAQERENAVHMPAAGDIAAMSANLLFAESPRFVYEKNTLSGDRLDKFIEENGFLNLLLEGAEISAALSGVFLKLDLDSRISDVPICSIINPIQAFPIFLRGRLWEILFYREVKTEKSGSIVYRLFENRKMLDEGGFIIEFKLYKGTNDKIGSVIDLNSIEETASLNLKDSQLISKVEGLGVVYIPNMKPNRLIPGSSLGINDFNGCIPLLDSLDLTWTSLIRDIELGMGQIFVDEELLTKEEKNIFGTEKTVLNQFSKFQKCFVKLNFTNYKMGNENMKPIEVIQFEMRVDEHLKACENLFKTIVSQCGYSASTFGMDNDGRAESGTALRIRERKSFLTREKKSRYWIPAIKKLLLMAQQMDNALNNVYYEPQNISIEIEDSVIIDQSEQSVTIRNLDQARAISMYMKVKMLHPEWAEDEIQAEVKRIQDSEEKDIFDLTNYKNNNEEEIIENDGKQGDSET